MKRTKSYSLHFVQVGDRSAEIVRNLAKKEIEKVLVKQAAVSHNLDHVLTKYI